MGDPLSYIDLLLAILMTTVSGPVADPDLELPFLPKIRGGGGGVAPPPDPPLVEMWYSHNFKDTKEDLLLHIFCFLFVRL